MIKFTNPQVSKHKSMKNENKKSTTIIHIIIIGILVLIILAFVKKIMDDARETPDSIPQGIEFEKETNNQEKPEELEESEEPEEPEEAEETKAPVSYINPEGMTAQNRVNTPEDYSRVEATSGSFLEFTRNLELKEDKSPVLLYDGNEKRNQTAQVAVYAFDVGSSDLQQCADSIMRVYSEYYWEKQAYENIEFHLTNGFLMDYTNWRDGKRIQVDGNNVSWVNTASYDDSYENFRKYLTQVMVYAGTLSLDNESSSIEIEDLKPGDMIIKGGSPGHCVLIVDEAENEDGDSCYLLAQGYMPAQEFHILKNPQKEDCPWYFEEDLRGSIQTPEYPFDESEIKRWNKGFD